MLIRLLRTYLAPYRTQLAGVVVLQLISVIAMLYLPSLNADLIDNGVTKGDIGYIWSTGLRMLAVTGVQIVASACSVYLGALAAMSAGRDLRGALLHRVGTFSAREVGMFGAPSLITRNTNDIQQVQLLIAMSATILVMAPIMCIGGIIMALREDFSLSWLLLIAVPVLGLSMAFIISRMVPGFRDMQTRIDEVNRVLREQITGIRVVRAFVRERQETWRFGVANNELTETALRVGRLMALMFPTVMLISNLTAVAVIWFGGKAVDEGTMQIGSLTAMLSYIMQILMAVMMASFLAMMAPRAAVSADRIGEVLETESSVVPPKLPQPFAGDPADVEFQFAEFAFPGAEKPVLKAIRFHVKPGTTTAIVGSTGSGKTTLLNLIPRLMDVTDGAVYLGGTDVRHVDLELLRAQVGLIPQKAYLFSGTVASNLRYGNPDATDEELWRCLEIAQAADFVREMPQGLETPIAQGGTTVSGGQRQRLAIARALVKAPRVYLFDDSFSALDVATDARLRDALRPVTKDASVIIVAQRITTIRDADQIVVLEDGEMAGVGSHEQLMRDCKEYQEIVASQLSAEEVR
ncbi:putative ABC transporter permease/ATP-binding protein [Nocardia brasiliensis NBRC 14402]|uniref:ABC transporter ATP-binding protein n=1 Tax=Nocardia brasiliensis TaxID=37326 RepID=UPI00030AA5E7|nr:ABC transporter ATP-binding protein [Nocardia brasiliensis]ASF10612.1 ABC transporter ATP-binding protein [Nocardia brasiliensis]MBF6129050.1 ABC transporter ATP-binding protein [Nocardia brasiliensis]MBF6545686.1 ABC transporter ATP-binding protein [Nocardia brasiliensis]SUB10840.1 Putative multidrug export ATP-binding/permease protein SAV1866 [Nocardia brasiliensis]GAJ80566.1 putative ABC transporter permease/ATP-binding protein [Nocardia brasiliensis NBRC 14402]